MNTHSPITWQERDAAGFMSLEVSARSDQAQRLVETLLHDAVIPAWPEGVQKRPSALEAHRRALAVFFGELQRLGLRDNAHGKHGMADKDFVGAPFGRGVFRRAADALEGGGLLSILGGWHWTMPALAAGAKPVRRGFAVTTFALTGPGLDLLEAHGVTARNLKDWRTHWARPETIIASTAGGPMKAAREASALVELRAANSRKGAVRSNAGEAMPVDLQDPRVAWIVAELETHNSFVAAAGVEGVVFSGVKRVFNNGDVDGFAWQWGGRFSSRAAGGYDSERKVDRLDAMRIGGEPVVEIDLRAAHLSILHALAGLPLDAAAQDPYVVGDLDRELVKRIVTQAIGRGDLKASHWSQEAVAYYTRAKPGRVLQADVPFLPARSAVAAALPALASAGTHGRTVHDLNFHESQIMTRAMARLRDGGVASVPVHDCLIVPESAEEGAVAALRDMFAGHLSEALGRPASVHPAMTIERRPSGG